MAERMALNITWVGERMEVGEKKIPKLSFKATNKEGKEYTYFTFKTGLFETIEKKGEIDVEVDVEEKGEYINRRVTQVYINGQPVLVKKQGGYNKSSMTPEDWEKKDRIERRSIERQVSAKIAAEIVEKPATIDAWKVVADDIFQWISETPKETTTDADWDKLGRENKTQPPPADTKKAVTPPAVENKETASTKQGKPHQDEAPPAQRKARNPESILTKNDLAIACHEDFNIQPKDILDYFHIKGWTELKKSFAEAYRDIQATRPD